MSNETNQKDTLHHGRVHRGNRAACRPADRGEFMTLIVAGIVLGLIFVFALLWAITDEPR